VERLTATTSVILFCYALFITHGFTQTGEVEEKPDQPSYARVISPDKLEEDLDFLFKTIEEVHPNMHAYTPEEEFKSLREQLYKDINHSMTVLEFYKLAAPVVAALKNSHTCVQPPYLHEFKSYYEGGGQVFPLEVSCEGSKVILSNNYSSTPLPLDAPVLTINGQSASEMFMRFSRLWASEGRSTNPWFAKNLHLVRCLLLLEFGPVESWDLKIRSNNGEVNSYTIKSVAATELEGQEAKTLASNSYQYLPEYNTSLLKIKSFGGDLEKFREFLNERFQQIRKQKVASLIIDVRENAGGGDHLIHPLMEYLTAKPYRLYEKTEIKISAQSHDIIEHIRRQVPDKFADKKEGDIVTIELPFRTPSANPLRFTGRIFVLISSQTFSASTVFASTVKCFHAGTLVGEETPDPPTLYGSCIFSKLSNSGLQVAVASKHLVAACGKPDGRGVLPHYEVKQKLEDTAKGIDTALKFTLNLIKTDKAKK
jgi:hypothetical protein